MWKQPTARNLWVTCGLVYRLCCLGLASPCVLAVGWQSSRWRRMQTRKLHGWHCLTWRMWHLWSSWSSFCTSRSTSSLVLWQRSTLTLSWSIRWPSSSAFPCIMGYECSFATAVSPIGTLCAPGASPVEVWSGTVPRKVAGWFHGEPSRTCQVTKVPRDFLADTFAIGYGAAKVWGKEEETKGSVELPLRPYRIDAKMPQMHFSNIPCLARSPIETQGSADYIFGRESL